MKNMKRLIAAAMLLLLLVGCSAGTYANNVDVAVPGHRVITAEVIADFP